MNLTAEEYAKVLARIKLIAEKVHADVTVMRERILDGIYVLLLSF